MDQRDIVGTWRLVSMKSYASDGKETYALGSNARGFIIYSPDGYMSALLVDSDRELLDTSDRLAGSEQQLAGAARGCIAYAGQYELQGDSVRHLVQASLIPDWLGTTLERRHDLDGERLTLTTPAMLMGGKQVTTVLVRERAMRLA